MSGRSLVVILLSVGCALVAGCSRDQEKPAPSKTAPDTVVQETTADIATAQDAASEQPAEPSVRYVPLDAPAGMAQAVIVEGFPLVHTRQLLPLDGEGKLVGEGSAEQQIGQVLMNLETVLGAAGSGLTKLVRLNVYADSPQTAHLVREQLSQRLGGEVRPAITAVVTPLPDPQALVAVDAVAMTSEQGDSVALQRCAGVAGDNECADASVVPRGGLVYLSGHPVKAPIAEAAGKSITALLAIVDQLKLQRSQVLQLRVFVESATAAGEVLAEVKRLFPGQLAPPVTFVQWIASAPVEIEMIAQLPLTGGKPAETVRFYTPPDVKPSPTFSRVALVQTDRQVYISGLSARTPGDGEAQVRDVFEQLKAILGETGSDMRHMVKAMYYVSDKDASTMLDKLRPEFYDPQRPPAASKVTVSGIAQVDRTLTIDMIAVGRGK